MSIILTKNAKIQYWIKYIDIQYYHIRLLVYEGELIIKLISSSEMLTDGITKVLFIEIFQQY